MDMELGLNISMAEKKRVSNTTVTSGVRVNLVNSCRKSLCRCINTPSKVAITRESNITPTGISPLKNSREKKKGKERIPHRYVQPCLCAGQTNDGNKKSDDDPEKAKAFHRVFCQKITEKDSEQCNEENAKPVVELFSKKGLCTEINAAFD